MISRDSIEEVRNRVDIIDVVSDFVSLKKSGQNFKALSPFGNEKTPSFYVVPAKGIFKDFSSGKGGDSFTFIMEHEKVSYIEAVRFLAKKYGVELKEDKQSNEFAAEQSEREGLYILMNFAKDYFKAILSTHDEGQSIGLSYFRERGFTDKTIQKFELGYALEGWTHFSAEAIQKGYNKDLLEKTGLVVKKEDGSTYDRFRGRVIFPVHNLSGKVIAFGARMMGKDKNQPKYINSPETDIYHKSDVLYGLFQGKNSIRQQNNCYLVEGYTDVISMHQANVENVVASSGTALTEEQIKLMRRFTENVTVLFDGDSAGIKAALRGIDLILKGGLNVRVALFPDGEDPDSYSRKVGTTAFHDFLKNSTKDFISFKADLFSSEAANDPIRKAESIKDIVHSISIIPDPVKRSVYIQETSHLLKMPEQVLLSELNKILVEERRKADKVSTADKSASDTQPTVNETVAPLKMDGNAMVQFQEKETIRLLLNYADKRLNAEDQQEALSLGQFMLQELDDVEFTNAVLKSIFLEFKDGLNNNSLRNTDYFLREGSDEMKRMVTDLITQRYDTSTHWGDKFNIYIPKETELLDKLAYTNVLRLKFRIVQKMMEDNLKELKGIEAGGDLEKLEKSMEMQMGLKQAERDLAGILGIVVSK